MCACRTACALGAWADGVHWRTAARIDDAVRAGAAQLRRVGQRVLGCVKDLGCVLWVQVARDGGCVISLLG